MVYWTAGDVHHPPAAFVDIGPPFGDNAGHMKETTAPAAILSLT
jgi:hypothetical protein